MAIQVYNILNEVASAKDLHSLDHLPLAIIQNEEGEANEEHQTNDLSCRLPLVPINQSQGGIFRYQKRNPGVVRAEHDGETLDNEAIHADSIKFDKECESEGSYKEPPLLAGDRLEERDSVDCRAVDDDEEPIPRQQPPVGSFMFQKHDLPATKMANLGSSSSSFFQHNYKPIESRQEHGNENRSSVGNENARSKFFNPIRKVEEEYDGGSTELKSKCDKFY